MMTSWLAAAADVSRLIINLLGSCGAHNAAGSHYATGASSPHGSRYGRRRLHTGPGDLAGSPGGTGGGDQRRQDPLR